MPGRQALNQEELLQKGEVPSGRQPIQAKPSAEFGEVDPLSRKDSNQLQQPGHRFQVLNVQSLLE